MRPLAKTLPWYVRFVLHFQYHFVDIEYSGQAGEIQHLIHYKKWKGVEYETDRTWIATIPRRNS